MRKLLEATDWRSVRLAHPPNHYQKVKQELEKMARRMAIDWLRVEFRMNVDSNLVHVVSLEKLLVRAMEKAIRRET